jgi:hypothetical protein
MTAATGTKRVATKVAQTAIWQVREVRMMALTCPVRRDPMAATMSTAAGVGMATMPTTPEKASKMLTPSTVSAHGDHRQCGYRQSDEGQVGPKPGAAEDRQDEDGRRSGGEGGEIDAGNVEHQVPGQGEVAGHV